MNENFIYSSSKWSVGYVPKLIAIQAFEGCHKPEVAASDSNPFGLYLFPAGNEAGCDPTIRDYSIENRL